MSWNYRVFRRKYPQSTTPIVKRDMYVLCETYYDEKGKPIMWSTEPEAGPCESVSELIEMLEIQLRGARKSAGDVLDYSAHQSELDWGEGIDPPATQRR